MKWFKNLFSKKKETTPKKGWLKTEQFYEGEMSGTLYYDHNGNVSKIYDLIPEPGFPYAYLSNPKLSNNIWYLKQDDSWLKLKYREDLSSLDDVFEYAEGENIGKTLSMYYGSWNNLQEKGELITEEEYKKDKSKI